MGKVRNTYAKSLRETQKRRKAEEKRTRRRRKKEEADAGVKADLDNGRVTEE
jgi:hypothetical protein